jgi:hypothetical protein
MRIPFLGRRLAIASATAGLLLVTLGVGSASAQNQTGPTGCEGQTAPILCVYQLNNINDNGNVVVFFPSHPVDQDNWMSLTAAGLTLPWGSFVDASGSSVAFGDASTGKTKCYPAESEVANPVVVHYRYMWIEYGVKNCTGTLGRLP